MKRTVKIKTTSLHTFNKIVNSFGKCPELIKELQNVTPKSFCQDVLGKSHWIVNEHGKNTCLLHKGNYAEYHSQEYDKTPTNFEVEVLDQSQITKNVVQLSRSLQESWAKNLNPFVAESQLNDIKNSLQRLLFTIESHTTTHKNSKYFYLDPT